MRAPARRRRVSRTGPRPTGQQCPRFSSSLLISLRWCELRLPQTPGTADHAAIGFVVQARFLVLEIGHVAAQCDRALLQVGIELCIVRAENGFGDAAADGAIAMAAE